MDSTIRKVFNFYDVLQNEDHRAVWQRVVVKICDTCPYVNESGTKAMASQGYTWKTREKVKHTYMLNIYNPNTAEQIHLYIIFYLLISKPSVSVHLYGLYKGQTID